MVFRLIDFFKTLLSPFTRLAGFSLFWVFTLPMAKKAVGRAILI